jgi:hypothetical protein
MPRCRSDLTVRQRALASAVVVTTIGVLASPSARAHFILQSPPSWMSQDPLGVPEKLGPCGDEGGGTATGTVTAFQPGQPITVTVDETIYHPGHYRIALAVNDRSELPAEPLVAAGSTPCGSVPIQSPAVFPVLADDVFDHTKPFTTPQSVQITLPNVTCTKCTLQIIEFMSDHILNTPGGCFYHHCADISIQGPLFDGGGGGDAGAVDGSTGVDGGGADASGNEAALPASSGCSVRAGPPTLWDASGFAAITGLALLRRRRPSNDQATKRSTMSP